jgi:hypothetical protein
MSDLRDQRAAFLGEEPSDTFSGRASGFFRGHWQGPGDDGPEAQFAGGDIDAALTWARAAAARVYVLVGDRRYWAGEIPSREESDLPWPDGPIAFADRPDGTPFDGSVQRRYWPFAARLTTDTPDAATAAEVERYLARQPDLRRVRVVVSPDGPRSRSSAAPTLAVTAEAFSGDGEYAMAALFWALEEVALRLPGGAVAGLRSHSPPYGFPPYVTETEAGQR